MDYNGSVESAVQAVYLDLLDTKRIAKSKEKLLQFSLMPHERKKWKSRDEIIDYWLSSTNENFFFFPFATKVETDKTIEVEVGKRNFSKP